MNYCDLCDLPIDQCVHGRPEPAVAKPVKPPAPAPKKAAARKPASSSSAKVEIRRVGARIRTPQSAYREAILVVMRELGGSGPVDEIVSGVEATMAERLLPGDYELFADEPRWRRAVRAERTAMMNAGLIEPVRQLGVWELTAQGLSES